MEELHYREHTSGDQEYQIGGRWSSTASGGTGSTGSGMTLTWSMVPDGTSLTSGAGEPNAPSTLQARLNTLYGSSATWLPLFQQVFDEWSSLTGIIYVYQPTDDGAAMSAGVPGVLGVRGDVRIGGHPIDGPSNILAYNYFPNFADMTLDTNEFDGGGFFTSMANNSRRLRNVVAHEHGHGLGFNHVDPINQTKLMEAFASTNFDMIEFDDALAGQRNYGDMFEKSGGNNTSATATNRGALGDGTDTIGNLTTQSTVPAQTVLSTTGDSDYYRFTVAADKLVNLTLTPTGPTYVQGSQGGSTSSFNATSQMDLRLQLIGSDGVTVLGDGNANGVGLTEIVPNVNVLAGTYYVRVLPAVGATNSAQPYRLTIALGPGGAIVTSNMSSVSPDPRTALVSSFNIDFSEAINPATFDLSDFTLTREGVTESLAGATLTTGNNINWVLGNLDSMTNRVGNFVLTMGTGMTTVDGRAPLSGDSDAWLMTGINGTSGPDTIRIVRSAGVSQVYINNPGPTANWTFPTTVSGMTSFTVLAGDGDDVVQFDVSGGTITPTGGATVDGGIGYDTFQVKGASGVDSYSITSTTVQRSSPATTFTYANTVEGLEFVTGRFNFNVDVNNGVDVTVRSGVIATVNSTQHLGDLTVDTGGVLNMPANGNRVLVGTSLAINGTGKLDLFDNDLLIDYSGATPYGSILSAIIAGRNGGDWLGNGLTSTSARTASPAITTLGLMEGSDYLATYGGGATFAGQPVDSDAVLVKYTYYGDADLNGLVDFDDYVRIDAGINLGLSGWVNGDFDNNGSVDFDDYVLIDQAINLQGAPL